MIDKDKELDEFENEMLTSTHFPIREFRRGEIQKVKIVKVKNDYLLVDVGRKSEAFIPIDEVYREKDIPLSEQFKVGDEILVKIVRGGGPKEGIMLSNKRAEYQVKYDNIDESYKALKTIEAKVIERVKGGLNVELDGGVRAFLPGTLIDMKRETNLEKYIDQIIRVKIVEFNRREKKLVVSRRIVEEEESFKKREDLVASLEVGSTYQGKITRVVDYGAFVEIGYGLEGLLHKSELSWSDNDPSDIIREGDELPVRIIGMSDDRKRISLSYKRTLPDPWDNINGKYNPGEIIEGKVVRDLGFGALIELEHNINAFIHISQISNKKIDKISDIISLGEFIKAEIIEVDLSQRKIKLSRRNLLPREVEEEKTTRKQPANDYSAYVDVYISKDNN